MLATGLQLTGLSERLIINRGNYKIRFSANSNLAATVWISKDARRDDELLMAAVLKPGDVAIDIGANIGLLTLTAAALVGEQGHTFAFEPHPTTFHCLQQNIALNHFTKVTPFNMALGDAKGTVHFSNYRSDDTNNVTEDGQVEVAVNRLDDVLAPFNLDKIDMLKVDVEGFEKHILLGAPQSLTLASCIFIETLDRHLQKYGTSSDEILGILRAAGFYLYRLNGDPNDVIGFKKQRSSTELQLGSFTLSEIR